MTTPEVRDLVRRTPFSFVGTVEHLQAATSGDLPIDDRTGVVRVDVVLQVPALFQGLEGQRITVQFDAGTELPAVGQQVALFAEGLAFGESIAVAEVGRLPVEAVAPQAGAAAEPGGAGRAFDDLQHELETEALRDHYEAADAAVLGRVVGMEQAVEPAYSEHDPLWWRATLDVQQVLRGDVPEGQLAVLYPNSIDIEWRHVPKPKASQWGLWMLHRTGPEQQELAPYQLVHAEDRQPGDVARTLSGDEG